MKQKKLTWKDKLGEESLQYLEVHRRIKEVSSQIPFSIENIQEIAKRQSAIIEDYPQLQKKETVNLKPEFLEMLELINMNDEHTLRTGENRLPLFLARLFETSQTIAMLAEKNPTFRASAYFCLGLFWQVGQGMYEDLRKKKYAATELDPKQRFDLFFETIETLAKTFRSPSEVLDSKGPRINTEAMLVIHHIRTHQKKKLTGPELFEALKFAGVFLPDEEAARVYEWRWRKEGYLGPESSRTPETKKKSGSDRVVKNSSKKKKDRPSRSKLKRRKKL